MRVVTVFCDYGYVPVLIEVHKCKESMLHICEYRRPASGYDEKVVGVWKVKYKQFPVIPEFPKDRR